MMPKNTIVPNKKAVLCKLSESMRVIGWHHRIQLKKRIAVRNQNIFFQVYTLSSQLQRKNRPNITIYNNCVASEICFATMIKIWLLYLRLRYVTLCF